MEYKLRTCDFNNKNEYDCKSPLATVRKLFLTFWVVTFQKKKGVPVYYQVLIENLSLKQAIVGFPEAMDSQSMHSKFLRDSQSTAATAIKTL